MPNIVLMKVSGELKTILSKVPTTTYRLMNAYTVIIEQILMKAHFLPDMVLNSEAFTKRNATTSIFTLYRIRSWPILLCLPGSK